MISEKFSWVETHKQIVDYLRTKENDQQEIIDLLKSVGVGPFNDKSVPGKHDILLDEIDPFTFFCYLYKYGGKRRLKYLQELAIKLSVPFPYDVRGLPSTEPRKVWLFPYKYERINNEVRRLWSFFNKALDGQLSDRDFEDVLKIKNVGQKRLTEALFYIAPERFLPINNPVIPYIKEVLKIDPEFSSFSEYEELLNAIKRKTDKPFYELSLTCWEWSGERKKVRYWIFQGNPDFYDIHTALEEGLLTDWSVNAHKDKIKTGDKLMLWMTGEGAGCYALAQVTSDPYRKTSSPDDHLWKKEDNSKWKVDIEITHNLVDSPILKSEIDTIEELKNLKVGNQGTNFSATEKEYKALLELVDPPGGFEAIRRQFKPEVFDQYIGFLRKINRELSLQPDDERLVYSFRNDRLNFIVGQRYTFNLFLSNPEGVFGVISKEKLGEHSEPFSGTPPQPFYNYFQEFEPDSQQWKSILNAIKDELGRTSKSGFRKNHNMDFENYVFTQTQEAMAPNTQLNYSLNTIFYGPPGTGKTYNTVLRAAEIIENRKIEDYSEALRVFRENLHSRIEFITFHQNYSYEDFIQGLRPDTENDQELTFERKDGVFKRISDRALKNIKESERPTEEMNRKMAFSEAIEKLKEMILDSEEPVKINETAYLIAVENDAFRYTGDNWTLKEKGFNGFRMKYSDLQRFFEEDVRARKDIKDLENISGLAKQHATYFFRTYELVKSLMSEVSQDQGRVRRKNYVIIIDEINRANISRVFGELITLIEPDKRFGGALPMEARLPSGDLFVVPSNLYIIGTMNTADKSIALLDIALRRRFQFEPMYPLYEIDGKEIYDVDMLKKINEKIINTKGPDFQIGHSYFMNENKDLISRMNNKVIPLLLEYYMNDKDEVESILNAAGLTMIKESWPLQIDGRND
jgi:5-methylcytosine-specific restriction protein B